jgi:NADH-quinone oxidoreductase subunit N
MSTPVIWLFVPVLVGVILFFLRRWYRTTVVIGTLTTLILAVIAFILPINELVRLGPVAFKVSDTFSILGRRLVLGTQDQPLIVFIYALVTFWFSAAFAARAGHMFVPVGLVLVAIWVAVLAVEPFLYAALLLELAVLLSIPLLSPPGSPPKRGAIRYLIFQTFGMPFILLTGWLLAGVQSSPGDLDLVVRATTLLGFGFIFLLGIFPFHSWLPMLAEESHPYPAAFIFFFMPFMVSLFGLTFLDQYAWLRQSTSLYETLRIAGILMMLIGGLWAALQRHFGRMLGFAILIGTGTSLVAISVSPDLELFFAMQFPRALTLAVWALGLSILHRSSQGIETLKTEEEVVNPPEPEKIEPSEALQFYYAQGLGRKLPLATAAVTLATLSFAGYPILAGFPVYQALWRNLATSTPLLAVLALFGSLSLGVSGIRGLTVLIMGKNEEAWQIREHWLTAVFLIIGILSIILLGLFPQWALRFTSQIAGIFSQLSSKNILP